ncbi:MAG: GNAT family N-acetyltransferase [Sulfuritalea sp.]|nr:GNAT family N-acetyltransferase [Sulfuritalea sp.]
MVQILLLSGHHDRSAFDCGNSVLNGWLATTAKQHRQKGISTTYVAVATARSSALFGFYSVSVAELRSDEVPDAWKDKLPQKVPVFRIGRLAVSLAHQRTGLGRLLLANAVSRLTRLASEVGGVGIVVDAKPDAVEFYRREGFEQMADHPLNLFLPL